MANPPSPIKGRGALSRPEGRFESRRLENFDDGWAPPAEGDGERGPPTTVTAEPARSIISRNRSPDIPFAQSINPYRGCEHGCIYCFARPSHAYLNLSPGIDFETRLFYKADAAGLLDQELRKPGYCCEPITLGANTDPYQPVERRLRVTRSLLEVMQRFSQPVTIITKSALVTRDIDILADMAQNDLVNVMVSVTTLDNDLKRKLEPRTPNGMVRLKTVQTLAEAQIPVGVLVAPIIPMINDAELEGIVEHAAKAGARAAGYVLLRLPYEVKDLFREWLQTHVPLRAEHVMSVIRQSRGGKDYDARFGVRMRGQGEFAELIAQRFQLACKRNGLLHGRRLTLSTQGFRVPPADGQIGFEFG